MFRSLAFVLLPATALAANVTTVNLTPFKSRSGAPGTLTATIFNNYRVFPTGAVQFTRDGVAIAGCENVGIIGVTDGFAQQGQAFANCTTTLPAGTYTLGAAYLGDAIVPAATSNDPPRTVGDKLVTARSLLAAGPVLSGNTVRLKAFIGSDNIQIPSGTVAFSLDSLPIAGCESVPLGVEGRVGVAECQAPAGAVGTHSATFAYAGDAVHFGGTAEGSYGVVAAPVASSALGMVTPRTAKVGESITAKALTFTSSFGRSYTFAVDGAATPGCVSLPVTIIPPGPQCTVSNIAAGRHVVDIRLDATPASLSSSYSLPVVMYGQPRRALDLDGDRLSDLLLTDAGGGVRTQLLFGNVDGGQRQLLPDGTGWQPTAYGDFNGDGTSDIVFTHTDGSVAIWLMRSGMQVGGARLLPAATGWSVKLAADFNGDGKSDLVWEHTDGRVAIWLMNGATQVGGAVILGAGTGWHPKQWADFNNDGRADLLWEHDDQSSALWLMDGTTQIGGRRLFGASTGWRSLAIGDVNGDGFSDIVWSHTDGRVATWTMNGITQLGGSVPLGAGTGYALAGVADMSNSGTTDLVFSRADGAAYIQTMVNGMPGPTRTVFAGAFPFRVVGVLAGDGLQSLPYPTPARESIMVAVNASGQFGIAMLYADFDLGPYYSVQPMGEPAGYTPVIFPN